MTILGTCVTRRQIARHEAGAAGDSQGAEVAQIERRDRFGLQPFGHGHDTGPPDAVSKDTRSQGV